jgi:hypothetical protein
MIVAALVLGAATFLTLGYLLRVVHVELIAWFAERREDRRHSKEWGGDEGANTTAWDHSEVSLEEIKEVPIAELPGVEKAGGRHRKEDAPSSRRLIHATDGTFEIPLVSSDHPGVLVSRRGKELAEDRRKARDRSTQSIDRPSDNVGEVSSSRKAVLRGSQNGKTGRAAVQGRAYELVPMPDWT